MYDQLIKSKFGNSLSPTLARRLHALFYLYTLDFANSILLEPCFRQLRKMRVSDSIRMLKGWCNGWATSRRYHEDKL